MASKTVPAKKKPTAKEDNPDAAITVIKKANCKNLNGTATLEYHIGLDPSSAVHWKIHSNSGNGMFSKNWVAFSDIQKALEDWSKDHLIVSMALFPLFKGKSVNTPSFLLACLVNEGIVKKAPGKKRHFQLGDTKAFLASLDNPKAQHSAPTKAKPKPTSKAATSMKTPRKKPATGK